MASLIRNNLVVDFGQITETDDGYEVVKNGVTFGYGKNNFFNCVVINQDPPSDGKWEWNGTELVPYSPPVVVDPQTVFKASQARALRNTLLAETDWRFRSDLTPSQSWKDYCQALRDITKQSQFPTEIEWPTPPQS